MNLFELASCYSSLGYHRTGSSSQLKTEDWLLETLKEFTDEVEIFNFDYPHFEAATEVLLNGRLISSMALYYEAVGELQDCRNVDLVSVKIGEDEKGVFETIKEKKKQARQKKCDALMVATNCASDSLYAFNVNPLLNDSIPVVLIAGREYKNLSEQEIGLCYSASIDHRSAKNIIARFGPDSTQAAIVITTPVSGWFECAGERGTGIALAIALARHLSKHCAVELVLCSGHELGYLGGFQYTASLSGTPAAVIHLGSCLATKDVRLEAWTNVESCIFNILNNIFRPQNIMLNKVSRSSHRSDWVGEAECWSQFNCPMLSIAGYNPVFHTPEDRIINVTSEKEMNQTLEWLIELTGALAIVGRNSYYE